ncbi:MAG: lysylphosphatidylglycerol synthase transmembrane domain-containing protein [Candidatus Fermentibacter sp.]|nr:lysylphosphatidylglycerol synthase transmembrane domain-containing protein [Candidatus Fermentibacter sp.]
MTRRARLLGILLPAAVSAGLLLLVYRRVDPGTLLSGLGEADPAWAVMYVLLSSIEPILRGLRWSMLAGTASPGTAIRGLFIAKAGNNLLPLRMGDAMRAQFIRDRAGVPYSRSVASILAESVLDLFFLGAIVLVFGVFLASSRGLLLAAAILVAVPLLAFLAMKIPGRLPQGIRRSAPCAVLGKIAGHLRSMAAGPRWNGLLVSTSALWILTLATSYCGLRMFLPEVPLLGVIATIVFVYFSVLVPSAPGFIGTYHAAVAGSLALMGYDLCDFPAAPVAIHLLQFVPQTLTGLALGAGYMFSNDWGRAWEGFEHARKSLLDTGERA